MTNHPRYSPPPQQHGYRPVSDQRGATGYSGHGQQQTYPQGYEWRYGQQPTYRQQYGPFGAGPPAGGPPPQLGPPPRKRSRAGALAVGAVAIAVVSAGIGGAAASVIEHHAQLAAAAAEQAARLLDVARSAPKSMKWKLRANVGDRDRWYEQPEEVAH